MLAELGAELTAPGHEAPTLAEIRRRLPVVRETDAIRRPRWRSECVPCPRCQEWRDAGAGWFLGRLPCTHNWDEAVAHSRPCVFTLCKANLNVEIKPDIGSLTLIFGDVTPADVEGDTCVEDVSARGGVTLEEVGAILGCTRERVRQVEEKGLRKMKTQTGYELGLPPTRSG